MAELICKHCGKPIELHGATFAGPIYKHCDPDDDKNCPAPEPEATEEKGGK